MITKRFSRSLYLKHDESAKESADRMKDYFDVEEFTDGDNRYKVDRKGYKNGEHTCNVEVEVKMIWKNGMSDFPYDEINLPGRKKKYLELEWDVSKISDYSNEEIEKLYTMKSENNSLYFGKASNLNITLNHKDIKDHKLHIIYYNFPELNSPPLKVTKTCGDKILSLYTNELIDHEDSIILIITEKISENIEKTIEDVYKKGQEKLFKS